MRFPPPQDVGSVRNTAVECIGHLFAYLTKVEPTLGRWELGLMCMPSHMNTSENASYNTYTAQVTIHTHTRTYIHVHTYYMYLCPYIRMYICMYICIHVYTHNVHTCTIYTQEVIQKVHQSAPTFPCMCNICMPSSTSLERSLEPPSHRLHTRRARPSRGWLEGDK